MFPLPLFFPAAVTDNLLPAAARHSLDASWQAVHLRLDKDVGHLASLTDTINFAIYYYCLYKTFAQPSYILAAQRLFAQILSHWVNLPPPGWPAQQLDQACGTAWLVSRLATDGLAESSAWLEPLDQAMSREIYLLGYRSDAASRAIFFRVLRYFSLRLPASSAVNHLQQLLALLPGYLTPLLHETGRDSRHAPLALGLAGGLATELLLLIRLAKVSLPAEDITQAVRQGIISLLALKRDVDFQDQKHAIFPFQMQTQSREATFSAELSWERGDLGPTLLFYEASKLLQDSELVNIAELVGLNTLLRTTSQSTAVTSSALWDGASGVAYLYHKLEHVSGLEQYQKGYLFWLDQTQRWLRQELALPSITQPVGSLQHGLIGTGLVLLSALNRTELDWDTVLL